MRRKTKSSRCGFTNSRIWIHSNQIMINKNILFFKWKYIREIVKLYHEQFNDVKIVYLMVWCHFSDDFDPRISLNYIIRDNRKESDVFRRKYWNFSKKIA